MNQKELLFIRCLNAEYLHTEEGGNYAIQIENNTLYLLFEASDGYEDWRNNLDFPAKPYHRMEDTWFAHRGFIRVWKAMRDQIEYMVEKHIRMNPNLYKIICVGYSHGGALALFATEDMVYRFANHLKIAGYGFGTPRVLWGSVPAMVQKRLQHFTVIRNVPDIVTYLPPIWLGYHHVGNMETIGEIGKYNPIDAHRPMSYLRELLNKKNIKT